MVVLIHSTFCVTAIVILMSGFNTHNVLHAAGYVITGTGVTTLISQLWLKMILMINMVQELHLQVQQQLKKCVPSLPAPGIFHQEYLIAEINRAIRLYSAIARNYKECNQFWSPGFASCVLTACGNLILASYIMVSSFSQPSADNSFLVALQARAITLIIGLILIHATQQYLEDLVSTMFPISWNLLRGKLSEDGNWT